VVAVTEALTELAQLANGDPQVAQIAQFLARREEALSRELAQQEQDDAARDEEAHHAALTRQQITELRRVADDLSAEAAGLRTSLDTVAAALGACPGCWGEDPACRWCRGRGRPGSMPPDPDAFELLVLPAVRLHAQLRRRTRPESEHHLAQTRSTT
jgi:hypothetical protein